MRGGEREPLRERLVRRIGREPVLLEQRDRRAGGDRAALAGVAQRIGVLPEAPWLSSTSAGRRARRDDLIALLID